MNSDGSRARTMPHVNSIETARDNADCGARHGWVGEHAVRPTVGSTTVPVLLAGAVVVIPTVCLIRYRNLVLQFASEIANNLKVDQGRRGWHLPFQTADHFMRRSPWMDRNSQSHTYNWYQGANPFSSHDRARTEHTRREWSRMRERWRETFGEGHRQHESRRVHEPRVNRRQQHYDALGVPAGASAADVKRAYLRKAKALHPDVNKDPDANASFARVRAAYEALS